MILKFHGQEYVCNSAQRKNGRIEIHTGRMEGDKEVIHYIYGDVKPSDVQYEGGTLDDSAFNSHTLESRVETLETSNAELAEAVDMILSGVTK